jgi:hypothetical protein
MLAYLALINNTRGSGVVYVFLGFSTFLFSVAAYAFARAAWAQTIRCQRSGSNLIVMSRESSAVADANDVRLAVEKQSGMASRPPRQYVVTVGARSWPHQYVLHRSFSRWGAERAARRIRGHLELAS